MMQTRQLQKQPFLAIVTYFKAGSAVAMMCFDDVQQSRQTPSHRDDAVLKMPPKDVSSLHVIDKKGKGIRKLLNGLVRSDAWILTKNANPNKTKFIFVHADSLTPSYVAARIIRFEDVDCPVKGKIQKRKAVIGTIEEGLSMRWPGKKKACGPIRYGPAPSGLAVAPPAIPMAVPAAEAVQDLYVAQMSTQPGLFKVGISGNVSHLMADLERSQPYRIILKAIFQGEARVELAVHHALKAYQYTEGRGTEWFQVRYETILRSIVDAIQNAGEKNLI